MALKPYGDFVGATYEYVSNQVASARSVNIYPRLIEHANGKGRYSFHSFPGISQFSNLSSFSNSPDALIAINGVLPSNDRLFAIVGTDFVEISSSGTPTDRGNLTEGNEESANGAASDTEIVFTTDGTNVYHYDLATNTLSTQSISATEALKIIWIDGYFVIADENTQQFYISARGDGTSWNSLDFTSAEKDPDDITSMISAQGQIWVGGRRSLQVFANTQDATFPFQPVDVSIEYGVLPGSLVRHDNGVAFIGTAGAKWAVYLCQGYTPVKISTYAIDDALNAVGTLVRAQVFSMSHQGHSFLVLSRVYQDGANENPLSYVYDSTTGLWSEWGYWTGTGDAYEAGGLNLNGYVSAFGKHLVFRGGGAAFQAVYEISQSVTTQATAPTGNAADEIKWLRRTPHISAAAQRVCYRRLELDGEGFNTLQLKYSNDGADNFSAAISPTAGSSARPFWSPLGSGRDRVFQVTGILDDAHVAIAAAYLDAEAGMH